MKLDLVRFFQACNPAKTLVVGKPEDRQYYIDFSKVRGGKIIEELGRTITRLSPNEPTCQLFTGHIGWNWFQTAIWENYHTIPVIVLRLIPVQIHHRLSKSVT